jgi:hypothetical protein
MNQDPGRSFLFLSPSERVVEVYCFGYEPLKIYLNDIGVRLKSGEVWQVKVTGDKKLDVISINILAEPTDAEIFIDDSSRGTGKTHQVSAGKHKLRVGKKGFKTTALDIDVSPSNVLFNAKLQEVEQLQATIKSLPTGATIFLNNAEKGKTDKALFLFPGTYSLKLLLTGYESVEKTIEVKEGEGNTFSYTLVKNSGTLSLSTNPDDAEVLINRESYSTQRTIELAPGKYKLEIRKEGYYDTTETIDITLGKSLDKNYTLRQKIGKLQFTIQPLEAEVTMKRNGVTVFNWTGATILKDIPVGSYEIECSKIEYKTLRKNITIEEGKTATEDFVMEKGSETIKEQNPYLTNDYKTEKIGKIWEMGSISVVIDYLHWAYAYENTDFKVELSGTGYGAEFSIPINAIKFRVDAMVLFYNYKFDYSSTFGGSGSYTFDFRYQYAGITFAPIIIFDKLQPSITFSYEFNDEEIKNAAYGYKIGLSYAPISKLNFSFYYLKKSRRYSDITDQSICLTYILSESIFVKGIYRHEVYENSNPDNHYSSQVGYWW